MPTEPNETLADMLDGESYIDRAKTRRAYLRSIGEEQRANACGRFGVVCPICLREQFHGIDDDLPDTGGPYCEHERNDVHDVLIVLGLGMHTPKGTHATAPV